MGGGETNRRMEREIDAERMMESKMERGRELER